MAKTHSGTVVLSLDFELRWGMHDAYGTDLSGYRENLEQVRPTLPALLRSLAAHNIRATWAAVGALGCENWEEYFRRAPEPPRYADPRLVVKREYAEMDPEGTLHFAPDLIHMILKTPGQELGTHTFSHLYLREAGVTALDVAADLAAVKKLYADKFDTAPRSLVFPRNQPAFVEAVRGASIGMWRGNPGPWYYECEDTAHNGPLPRALKLIDGVNPLRRLASPVTGDMTRASMFLRLNLPRYLWNAHVRRIKGELSALKPDDVFHIWFHPHNLGQDTRLRLSRVEEVLALVAEEQEKGGLRSCSMGDLIQ